MTDKEGQPSIFSTAIHIPQWREDVSLGDMVSIELPAAIWIAFSASYLDTEWGTTEASVITMAIQYKLMKASYIKEMEAHRQDIADRQDALNKAAQQIFPGFLGPDEDDPRQEGGTLK